MISKYSSDFHIFIHIISNTQCYYRQLVLSTGLFKVPVHSMLHLYELTL